MLNLFFLVLVYIILIAYMLNQHFHSNDFGSDDQDSGGDGGWDSSDEDPPLDLPPGVFLLAPDEEDPSVRHVEKELAL